jgi:hypothetical protein
VATTYEPPGLLQPYPYTYAQAQDPDISPSTASDLTVRGDRILDRHDRPSNILQSPRSVKRVKRDHQPSNNITSSPVMKPANGGGAKGTETAETQTASKPKRVRTGCLTCRERHLKCDEGLPVCQNCRKSSRTCKRGVRLNFIDTTVKAPAVMAPIHDWNVTFLDESREIASEYRDGLSKYIALEERPSRVRHSENGLGFDFSGAVIAPSMHHQQALPPIQGMLPDTFQNNPASLNFDSHQPEGHHQHTHSHSESTYSGSNIPTTAGTSYGSAEQQLVTSAEGRDYVRDPSEVLYMQVFIEEVGLWMDSGDAEKHVCNNSG